MAFTGSIQNKRPGAGVYPGAGVASGGQQGRMRLATGGAASVKPGGATAGASQRAQAAVAAASKPSLTQQANKAASISQQYATNPYRSIMRNGQRVLVRLNQLTPAELAAMKAGGGGGQPGQPAGQPGATAPATGTPLPGVPAYTPSFALHDSQYFMDAADQQGQLDGALNPLQSELTKLQYHGVGGKTLYDTMYDKANSNFMDQVGQSRNDASAMGLLRSGFYDKQAGQMAGNMDQQLADINNQYGAGRINDLNTQMAQARAQAAAHQQALEMAAAQRAQDRLAAANAAAYGQTIMPTQEG